MTHTEWRNVQLIIKQKDTCMKEWFKCADRIKGLEARNAQLEASKARADAMIIRTRNALKEALERDRLRKHPAG